MVKQKKLKSSEKELARKRKYYQENKKEILEKKKERSAIIYTRKKMREMANEDEFEKEFMRKMSRMEQERKLNCEACGVSQDDIDHQLEAHHDSYVNTEVMWLCKPCHAEFDMLRRRRDAENAEEER